MIKSWQPEEIVVVLGNEADKVGLELKGEPVTFCLNADFTLGMHSSIRQGLLALTKPCDGFFICLADQPELASDHYLSLIKGFASGHSKGTIFAPYYRSQRGNPVLFARKYLDEILCHPDGDYGCSYLLKKYPDELVAVAIDSPAVIEDIDDPEDYLRAKASVTIAKPSKSIYQTIDQCISDKQSVAIATVVEVFGSSSARVGSKAIFTADGVNLQGWIGGGCAERFVAENCREAIDCRTPRMILADLEDEIFGLGVDCGGKMKLFIEPLTAKESVPTSIAPQFSQQVAALSAYYGVDFISQENPKDITALSEQIVLLAKHMASFRGCSNKPLRTIKSVATTYSDHSLAEIKSIKLVGKGRITEALARHFSLLGLTTSVMAYEINKSLYPGETICYEITASYLDIAFEENDIVIIANHSAQDPKIVELAIEAGASYIGMIGSKKRSKEVLSYLGVLDQTITWPLFIPAGLDLEARNPDEIALSIVAEILNLRSS